MDAETLSDLVERHATALVVFARQRCDCPEDVVQTAFLRLVQQRVAPNEAVAWLYRVVRNAAGDEVRKRRRRQQYETRAATGCAWFVESQDAELDSRDAVAALAELPTETREIVVSHIWGRLTFEQIASMCDSSAATCYRRYAAGLATLRERFRVALAFG